MAIKGLTDNVRPAFPRLGKLRKGGERPASGNRPGPELSYWRFTSDDPMVEQAFAAAYGAEPIELDVYLPFASITDNFEAWQEKWSAGGLQHRCDGETCVRWLDTDGHYKETPIDCPGGCTPVGRLNVILPDLLRAGHVGYVTMETHSINDIASLQGTLEAVAQARGVEDMRGVGFLLRRVEREISTPADNGKRARRTKHLVELLPAAQWVTAQIEASRHEALALPSADDDEPGAEIIDVDFETGEITEPEPQHIAPSRPYPPETVRKAIASRVAKGSDETPANGLRGATVGALTALFGNDSKDDRIIKRRTVAKYLLDKPHSADWTKAECGALLDWAQDEIGENGCAPNEHAIYEAAQIVTAHERALGQEAMPL